MKIWILLWYIPRLRFVQDREETAPTANEFWHEVMKTLTQEIFVQVYGVEWKANRWIRISHNILRKAYSFFCKTNNVAAFIVWISLVTPFDGFVVKWLRGLKLFSEKDEKAPKAKGKLQCHIEEKSHLTKFNAALSKRELGVFSTSDIYIYTSDTVTDTPLASTLLTLSKLFPTVSCTLKSVFSLKQDVTPDFRRFCSLWEICLTVCTI